MIDPISKNGEGTNIQTRSHIYRPRRERENIKFIAKRREKFKLRPIQHHRKMQTDNENKKKVANEDGGLIRIQKERRGKRR